jgi:ATP-dependent Clp protease ATP-binding subunit ClpA
MTVDNVTLLAVAIFAGVAGSVVTALYFNSQSHVRDLIEQVQGLLLLQKETTERWSADIEQFTEDRHTYLSFITMLIKNVDRNDILQAIHDWTVIRLSKGLSTHFDTASVSSEAPQDSQPTIP